MIAKALLKQVEDIVQEHVDYGVPVTPDGLPEPSWFEAVRFEIRAKCEPIAYAYGESMHSVRIALDVLFFVFTVTMRHGTTFRLTGEDVSR